MNLGLWLLCEMVIIVCDLVEVIGIVIVLKLLFGILFFVGVVIMVVDVVLVLLLMYCGFCVLEVFVIVLLLVIFGCFVV